MQTRIRETRKRKGLTLEELAQRVQPATTAQTIGRLETGDRKMTLDWLERIATALDCAPGELMNTGREAVRFAGSITRTGHVAPTQNEILGLHLPGRKPVALKLAIKVGDLEVGDTLICDRSTAPGFTDCLDRDCLITTADDQQVYGHLIAGSLPDRYTIILGGEVSGVLYDVAIKSAARRLMLIRYY